MTKKTIVTFVAAVAITSSVAAAPEAPATLTLSLDPATTLPALPVTFRLTVPNSGPKVLQVPRRAILLVAPAGGESFIAGWGGEGSRGSQLVANLGEYIEDATVPPGKSVTVSIPIDWTLLSPYWFEDSRLCAPGTYDLRIALDDNLTNASVRNRAPADVIASAALVSNATKLVVAQPAGVDAEVYLLLSAKAKALSAGVWKYAADLGKTIVTSYPASTYARFMAAKVPGTPEEMIRTVQKALQDDPNGPLQEWYRLYLADREMLAYAQMIGHDNAAAKTHANNAAKVLSALAKNAKESRVRKLAAAKLDDVNETVETDFP